MCRGGGGGGGLPSCMVPSLSIRYFKIQPGSISFVLSHAAICSWNDPNYSVTINVPVVYIGRGEMILMWATSISRISTFLGPYGTRFARDHFRAQKSLDFQAPSLPIARVMDVAHFKIIKSKLHIKKWSKFTFPRSTPPPLYSSPPPPYTYPTSGVRWEGGSPRPSPPPPPQSPQRYEKCVTWSNSFHLFPTNFISSKRLPFSSVWFHLHPVGSISFLMILTPAKLLHLQSVASCLSLLFW